MVIFVFVFVLFSCQKQSINKDNFTKNSTTHTIIRVLDSVANEDLKTTYLSLTSTEKKKYG